MIPKSLCLKGQRADEIHINLNCAGLGASVTERIIQPNQTQVSSTLVHQLNPMAQWILVIWFHSASSSLDIR